MPKLIEALVHVPVVGGRGQAVGSAADRRRSGRPFHAGEVSSLVPVVSGVRGGSGTAIADRGA